MKKLHKGIVALRIVVMFVPIVVLVVTDLISDYTRSGGDWLAEKLPNPWR